MHEEIILGRPYLFKEVKAVQESFYTVTYEGTLINDEKICWDKYKPMHCRVNESSYSERFSDAPIAQWCIDSKCYDDENKRFYEPKRDFRIYEPKRD